MAMAAAVAATAMPPSLPLLVYNASASVPPGFYIRRPSSTLRRGDLVLAHLPPAIAAVAQERGYLPAGVPLLKPVAALGGDRVCAEAGALSVNGEALARALERDRQGRPLTAWSGCRTLAADEVLLLRAGTAQSFDGRYFGPLRRSVILAAVAPLWTGGEPRR